MPAGVSGPQILKYTLSLNNGQSGSGGHSKSFCNKDDSNFFLFVFGFCLCYHRENRAQNAPKQEEAVMEKIKLEVAGIPAVLYGKRSRRVYLYVHGKNGSAAEAARFARTACPAGWQVLAVDLPEHGTRKNSPEKLVPWVVTRELQAVYARMQPVWKHIRVYGVSIGAWFAMQALQTQKPEKALLVSPIVDMEKLILALMQQAGVTEEQLHAAGEIPTDFGETLSWPYLCWVREHPLHWKVPTQVLYADTDPLTGHTAMERFRQQTGAHLTILEGGEHWFHTETQLAALQSWESCHL